jgi:hypothetical protein
MVREGHVFRVRDDVSHMSKEYLVNKICKTITSTITDSYLRLTKIPSSGSNIAAYCNRRVGCMGFATIW